MEKKFKKITNFFKNNLGVVIVVLTALVMSIFSIVAANFADIPININTIEEFRNIENTGMDKHYVITGYLTFEDWEPLGDEDHPFTGILESKNPIEIKSFKEDTNKNSGIFAVNEGIILGIKVYCPTFIQSFTNVESFGLFAGINRGKITSCNAYMGYPEVNFGNIKNVSVGVFCGTNYGDIRKCVSTSQFSIRNTGHISYGTMCGSSYGGIIELCTAQSPTNIYGTSVSSGGLCGNGSSTFIKNCYVSSKINIFTSDGATVGGLIGVVDEGETLSIANCYTMANIIINNTEQDVFISCVGKDEYGNCSITNCVSNISILPIVNDFVCGSFFTDKSHFVNNSYYISVPRSDNCFMQGENATFCDLSLKKLKWDSAIWKVSCSGIECVIVYER